MNTKRYIPDLVNEKLTELLAIKLYEHDNTTGKYPPEYGYTNWFKLAEEDRNLYRDMASGKRPLNVKIPGEYK